VSGVSQMAEGHYSEKSYLAGVDWCLARSPSVGVNARTTGADETPSCGRCQSVGTMKRCPTRLLEDGGAVVKVERGKEMDRAVLLGHS
jgi:hypothetical protein